MFKKPTHKMKVIITGGPRSGTSFLAGLVHQMGFHAGNTGSLKKADQHNKYGYYEHLELMNISNKVLQKLGGDFHFNIPELHKSWTDAFDKEKNKILKIASKEGIEMYKGNQLMVLADLYVDIFPEAKWIYIERDLNETFSSRFGSSMSLEDWTNITVSRKAAWNRTAAQKNALPLDYSMFAADFDSTFALIEGHLEMKCDTATKNQCKDFFRPSAK